jgi:hypothetical protein
LQGKKDGQIIVESTKPKLSGGARKVADESFTDSAWFKETGEISGEKIKNE